MDRQENTVNGWWADFRLPNYEKSFCFVRITETKKGPIMTDCTITHYDRYGNSSPKKVTARVQRQKWKARALINWMQSMPLDYMRAFSIDKETETGKLLIAKHVELRITGEA